MARFGRDGERGSFETHETATGLEGHFRPAGPADDRESGLPRPATVKLISTDPANDLVRIYPANTLPTHPDFLGPKYKQITSIAFPLTDLENIDIIDLLEDLLPSGFIKDPEYGLGLIKEYLVVIDLIEKHTDCDTIELTYSPSAVKGRVFQLNVADYRAIQSELDKIKNRGGDAIHRVKAAFAHNALAEVLGLQETQYTLGTHPTSKWMTKVAAGENALTDNERDALLSATATSAAAIAARVPIQMVRLQRDIELVNLNQLLDSYGKALVAGHKESWWQKFFEENVFVLQLLFGGPTVFVDSQVPIGAGGNSAKGVKIADYLFRNPMTNNAALVEIKRPNTKLMSTRPYREGVYGVSSEIAKSVAQVLDQALQLTEHASATRTRTPDGSWLSTAPRCFVVVGRTAELTNTAKQKSFELFREHLAGVRLVTYDELFGQLQVLRDYLATDD